MTILLQPLNNPPSEYWRKNEWNISSCYYIFVVWAVTQESGTIPTFLDLTLLVTRPTLQRYQAPSRLSNSQLLNLISAPPSVWRICSENWEYNMWWEQSGLQITYDINNTIQCLSHFITSQTNICISYVLLKLYLKISMYIYTLLSSQPIHNISSSLCI